MFLKKQWLFMGIFLIMTNLQAETFEVFLQKAVSNNNILKADILKVQQQKKKADILTRWKNPELELAMAKFGNESDEIGFNVGLYSQIPLPHVQKYKIELAEINTQSEISKQNLNKAKFIQAVSLKYLHYLSKVFLLEQSVKESQLAKSIYNLAKARFHAGNVSKGESLRASVDYKLSLQEQSNMKLQKLNSYYALLRFANSPKEVYLDTSYEFKVLKTKNSNPKLLNIEKQLSYAKVISKLNENTIESVGIFAELEKEPDMDIYRAGFTLPLAIFNNKNEEKQISKLEIQKQSLFLKNEKQKQDMKLRQLSYEYQLLTDLQEKNSNILKEEQELLSMFKKGYKIANTKLLELQDIQNKLIKTQKRLIGIKISKYRNIIEQNYLQGAYNE